MKKYDYIIVGAGLFGSTFTYLAKNAGKRCLVLEKRKHTGGNIYCENVEGINVHKYGAHIFHTSNEKVWKFVNSLIDFNRYTNSPIANYNGELYNLPFNMNTFYQLWGTRTPAEAKAIIKSQRMLPQNDVASNLEEQALALVGKDIYEKLIKGYTEKQWGRDCKDLPAFIIRRLPLRYTYDNNYFLDTYQGVPINGYNKLIDKMLSGADVMLGVDFLLQDKRNDQIPSIATWKEMADKLVFTGKIDEFYGYCLGKLEYRTVIFENEILHTSNYQGNAVINYTDRETPFTRIIEHKHFESFGDDVYRNPMTVISREYSMEWQDGMEAFYPINNASNITLANRYKKMAEQEQDVLFGGRLAEYKYYDMAPIIEKVMNYWGL